MNFFKGKNKKNALDGIYTCDAFRAILEKVRARSERSGEIFSLVLFSCNNGNGTNVATLTRLGKDITRRTRKSDEVGWYDGNCIGTILPGSSAEEAWQFVEVIKKRIGDVDPGLICTVNTYPSPRSNSNVQWETTKEHQPLTELTAPFNVQAKSSTRRCQTQGDGSSD